VFGLGEAVADGLDLVQERKGAEDGATGPASQVAHAFRMVGQEVLCRVEVIGPNSWFVGRMRVRTVRIDTRCPVKSIADQLPPEIARQIHPDRGQQLGKTIGFQFSPGENNWCQSVFAA
jgi:hypothetical protein